MRIIAGEAGSRRIEAPPGRGTRPTLDRVRENLFNMLQGDIYGKKVLDLFAGSGALSLEAISRGAESAVLVDCDREAHRTQIRNIHSLGFDSRAETMLCDWRAAIRNMKEEKRQFDLVFLDPPYEYTDLREVFSSLYDLLSEEAVVVLEHEAKKEIRTGSGYCCIKTRSWGFCAADFYKKNSDGTEK